MPEGWILLWAESKLSIARRRGRWHRIQVIKTTGIFLLVSGWIIVLTAVALLPQGPLVNGFVPAGMVVEGIGLVLLFRSHLIAPGEHR